MKGLLQKATFENNERPSKDKEIVRLSFSFSKFLGCIQKHTHLLHSMLPFGAVKNFDRQEINRRYFSSWHPGAKRLQNWFLPSMERYEKEQKQLPPNFHSFKSLNWNQTVKSRMHEINEKKDDSTNRKCHDLSLINNYHCNIIICWSERYDKDKKKY